ncbi:MULTISPECIES: heme exporter protein CcmD [Microvirga]|uniref:heme exporter protein CcmD n=1 Tax=Microvirga TaxID=186650 RepID=UPI001CFC4BA5|nr:heme exporter protein CcmD [Microvirga lenta]MCB5174693.1 heme exporter protein CcmD [Microvirga lenta]
MSQHAFFILSSYAVTGLVMAGLIVRAVLDHRAQTRALAELEARGIGRRSRRG